MRTIKIVTYAFLCIAFFACQKSENSNPSSNSSPAPSSSPLAGVWVCDSGRVCSTQNGTYTPYTMANGTTITFIVGNSGNTYSSAFQYPLMIGGSDNGAFTYAGTTLTLTSSVIYHGTQTATVLLLTKTQMEIQINDPATYPNQWYKIWFTFV